MTDGQTDRQTWRNFLYANNGHIHRIATHALFIGGETLHRHCHNERRSQRQIPIYIYIYVYMCVYI